MSYSPPENCIEGKNLSATCEVRAVTLLMTVVCKGPRERERERLPRPFVIFVIEGDVIVMWWRNTSFFPEVV